MATVSQPFTITVTITPRVTSIGLSNATITSGRAGSDRDVADFHFYAWKRKLTWA